jgi:serine/threonine protein kinase
MSHVIAERYTLTREIGRGGMGAVWLGHDNVLQRQVALKQVGLLPGSDRADVERVRREARVSAMMNHPNVVSVFDLVAEHGRHWLVMEYVDSETLADLVRRKRRLSPDEIAPIIAQTAQALAAAHDAGIVHRDVKPSNILLGRDGAVKLGDFGIARTSADPTLTQTGMVTGSPGYMAPEVASGRSAKPASDVWSLGATVFHALTGKPPYDTGENLMGALYRLVNDEPPRTDRAGWLAPLLLATMHRDPKGRWTAGQVATFLERGPAAVASAPKVPKSVPVPVAPTRVEPVVPVAAPADETQLLPAPGRRRWVAAAAAGVLLLGLVLAALLLDRDPEDTSPPSSSPTTTAPETQAPRPTAAGMEAFIRDYLTTVADDPALAWSQLTRDFQTASGGYRAYTAWWGGLKKATLQSVDANPADLKVSYDVRYDWEKGQGKGKLKRDDPTLELAFDGRDYLIAYED